MAGQLALDIYEVLINPNLDKDTIIEVMTVVIEGMPPSAEITEKLAEDARMIAALQQSVADGAKQLQTQDTAHEATVGLLREEMKLIQAHSAETHEETSVARAELATLKNTHSETLAELKKRTTALFSQRLIITKEKAAFGERMDKSAETIAQHEKDAEANSKSMSGLNARIAQLNTHADLLTADVKEVTEKNRKAQTLITQLKAANAASDKDSTEMEEKISAYQAENERKDAERQIAHEKTQTELRTATLQLAGVTAEVRQKESQIAELEAKVKGLVAETAPAEENTRLKAEVEKLTLERDALQIQQMAAITNTTTTTTVTEIVDWTSFFKKIMGARNLDDITDITRRLKLPQNYMNFPPEKRIELFFSNWPVTFTTSLTALGDTAQDVLFDAIRVPLNLTPEVWKEKLAIVTADNGLVKALITAPS